MDDINRQWMGGQTDMDGRTDTGGWMDGSMEGSQLASDATDGQMDSLNLLIDIP